MQPSKNRRLPELALDLHNSRLLVRETDLAFFIEASFLEIINESGREVKVST
jgi:hypothetical protein